MESERQFIGLCSASNTYITDRKPGLVGVIEKVQPSVHIGACTTHLLENLEKSKLKLSKRAIEAWQKIKHARNEADVQRYLKLFEEKAGIEANDYFLTSMWDGEAINKTS